MDLTRTASYLRRPGLYLKSKDPDRQVISSVTATAAGRSSSRRRNGGGEERRRTWLLPANGAASSSAPGAAAGCIQAVTSPRLCGATSLSSCCRRPRLRACCPTTCCRYLFSGYWSALCQEFLRWLPCTERQRCRQAIHNLPRPRWATRSWLSAQQRQ